MKHLYIIGNGFDIYAGLATRYSDFRRWLENNNPFIYESMQAVYDIDTEWWNDFEEQLGLLDIKKYVKKFTPPNKPIAEIRAEIEQRKKIENSPPVYRWRMLRQSRSRRLGSDSVLYGSRKGAFRW